jgi:probable addiction module antidote protein
MNKMNKKKLLKYTGSFHELLIESLCDPKKSTVYLQVALDEYQEDGDTDAFLKALRNIAEAQGGIGTLAKKTKLNRQNLYSVLSDKGNPRLNTLSLLLKIMGFHLSVKSVYA